MRVVWSASGWELLVALLLFINSGVDDIKAAQNYCHEHDCAGTVGWERDWEMGEGVTSLKIS